MKNTDYTLRFDFPEGSIQIENLHFCSMEGIRSPYCCLHRKKRTSKSKVKPTKKNPTKVKGIILFSFTAQKHYLLIRRGKALQIWRMVRQSDKKFSQTVILIQKGLRLTSHLSLTWKPLKQPRTSTKQKYLWLVTQIYRRIKGNVSTFGEVSSPGKKNVSNKVVISYVMFTQSILILSSST